LELAEQAEPYLRGADQLSWIRRLESEHDNLRIALDWFLEQASGDLAARLGAALWFFWYQRCHFHEGRQWLERILATPATRSATRGRVLSGAGYLNLSVDEPRRAMALHEEALVVLEAHGSAYDIAMSHRCLGRAALRLGELTRAAAELETALNMVRELDDTWGI